MTTIRSGSPRNTRTTPLVSAPTQKKVAAPKKPKAAAKAQPARPPTTAPRARDTAPDVENPLKMIVNLIKYLFVQQGDGPMQHPAEIVGELVGLNPAFRGIDPASTRESVIVLIDERDRDSAAKLIAAIEKAQQKGGRLEGVEVKYSSIL
ncbi:MAG: hypothetical protein AB1938_17235 [Myxococcota bacterium]